MGNIIKKCVVTLRLDKIDRMEAYAILDKLAAKFESTSAPREKWVLDVGDLGEALAIDRELAEEVMDLFEAGAQLGKDALEKPQRKSVITDRQLTYDEMVAFLALMSSQSVDEKITLLFTRFDKDKNGFLDKDEVKHMLRVVYGVNLRRAKNTAFVQEQINQLEETVDRIFKEADKDNNGKIDEHEFMVWSKKSDVLLSFWQNLRSLGARVKQSKFRKTPGDDTFRILCVDGGGSRGIIPANVLARIEKEYPGFIDSCDLYAGTSTGAIIAAMLAVAYPISDLCDIYMDKSAAIFGKEKTTGLGVVDKLLLDAKYDPEPFEQLVKSYGGGLKLGNIEDKKLLIPVFDLAEHTVPLRNPDDSMAGSVEDVNHWGPVYYHNFHTKDATLVASNAHLHDVVLSTAAAPTYFPAHNHAFDGGLVCNNPSAAALAHAVSPLFGNKEITKVRILSLGTGVFPQTWKKDALTGLQAEELIKMFLDANTQFSENVCSLLLGEHFHRIQPRLGFDFPLDSKQPTALQAMVRVAENLSLDGTLEWVKTQWFNGKYTQPKDQPMSAMKAPVTMLPSTLQENPEVTVTSGPYFDLNRGLLSKNTVIVLLFWGTWCEPSLRAMEYMNGIYRQYRDFGLHLLALSKEDVKTVGDFVRDKYRQGDILFSIGSSEAVWQKWSVELNLNSTPRAVVIVNDSVLYNDNPKHDEFEEALVSAFQLVDMDPAAAAAWQKEGYNAALVEATKAGKADEVRVLLKKGADVDAIDHTDGRDSTPLMWAAWNGHLECVKILLDAGANVNAVDKYNCTSTSFAHQKQYAEIENLLKAKGGLLIAPQKVSAAQVAATGLSQEAIDKGQALILATQEGRAEDVRKFLRDGVPVDYRDVTDGRDSTPLMWAAWNGHLECVKALLDGGADVNAVDRYNCSSLQFSDQKKFTSISELLRSKGGFVYRPGGPAPPGKGGQQTQAAAQQAAAASASTSSSTTSTTVGTSAVNNAVSDNISADGQALIEACKLGLTEEIRKLLAKGTPVDYRDKQDGRDSTPLMWAAWRGQLDACRILLDAGADVNAVDNHDCSSTYWSMVKKFKPVEELLKSRGGLEKVPKPAQAPVPETVSAAAAPPAATTQPASVAQPAKTESGAAVASAPTAGAKEAPKSPEKKAAEDKSKGKKEKKKEDKKEKKEKESPASSPAKDTPASPEEKKKKVMTGFSLFSKK